MRKLTAVIASAVIMAASGAAPAQTGSSTSENSASPSKEADKMKNNDKTGSTPNSSIPGANPAADGNATQDSRTTKTKDR